MSKNNPIRQKKDELRKRAQDAGVFKLESEDDQRKRELKAQGRVILSALVGGKR